MHEYLYLVGSTDGAHNLEARTCFGLVMSYVRDCVITRGIYHTLRSVFKRILEENYNQSTVWLKSLV